MVDGLNNIKTYHIIHIDRFASVLSDGFLYCDAEMLQKQTKGPTIGISNIKERRLVHPLASFPELTVGQCVPFYFCPRSVMLYVIKCQNHPDLAYLNGQDDIIHLVFDLQKILDWAMNNKLKTCYTTSNAGSKYFEDYSDFSKIIERDLMLGGSMFVIGGAYGMSEDVKRAAHALVSLSPMTFTHEWARAILAEQLYRAKTISADTGYHH